MTEVYNKKRITPLHSKTFHYEMFGTSVPVTSAVCANFHTFSGKLHTCGFVPLSTPTPSHASPFPDAPATYPAT